MNIMHFSLGFQPLRSGGLVKYATDLAKMQADNGDKVYVVWPGKFTLSKKTKLKIRNVGNLVSIEIINGLPITLTYGVSNPEKLMIDINVNLFLKMFSKFNIDIFHIHTFMGLPISLLKECKNRKIKVVFTTHDYYPFCAKTKMYFDNKICINNEKCSICNSCAPSIRKIKLNQSVLGSFVRKIKFLKSKFKPGNNDKKLYDNGFDYSKLKNFYLSFFQYIDIVHCNSSVSYDVYKNYIPVDKIKVLPISHIDLKYEDIAKIKSKKLRIGYFGEETKEKGFPLLLEVLDDINDDFELFVYGKDDYFARNYLNYNGSYKYSDLIDIYKKIDVVIVPSVWKETFGFVAIEALCHKVPVICSNNIGAKDFANPSWTFSNKEDLKIMLNRVIKDKSSLEDYFKDCKKVDDFRTHFMKIRSIIYE